MNISCCELTDQEDFSQYFKSSRTSPPDHDSAQSPNSDDYIDVQNYINRSDDDDDLQSPDVLAINPHNLSMFIFI